MKVERKYIIKSGEYFKAGKNTYVALRLEDIKRIEKKLGEELSLF